MKTSTPNTISDIVAEFETKFLLINPKDTTDRMLAPVRAKEHTDWLETTLTTLIQNKIGEIEGKKSDNPTFSLADAFEGQNSGDIADAANRDGFNAALQEAAQILQNTLK